jgi:hypothetical protein
MLSPTHTCGAAGCRCTISLRVPCGGVIAQLGEPQPLAFAGVPISIEDAALAPGRSTMRVRRMDHAPVASAYLMGTAAGRGRVPRMATFGQPSTEQVMSPALRKTITVTMPGMVSAAESGPPTRRSCSAQRGTGREPGLTATAGRAGWRPSTMEPPTTAIAATPTTAPRAATPRRAGRPVISVSRAAAAALAVSTALAVFAWHGGRSGLRHASWTPSDISRVLVPAARIRHSGARSLSHSAAWFRWRHGRWAAIDRYGPGRSFSRPG